MNVTRLNLTTNKSSKDFSVDMRRKKLIEKIAISLKLQHNGFLTQMNYTIKELISDLKEIVSLEDLDYTNYDSLLNRVEHIILEKLSKTNKYKSRSNDFSSTTKTFSKRENLEDQKLRTISIPDINRQTSNQNGTWSKLAKYFDMKSKEMDMIEKLREKQKKLKFNESLVKQLKDRELVYKKENEMENSLIKKHFDYVKTLDNRDKMSKDEKTRKIKEETKKMMSISLERNRKINEEKDKQKQEGYHYIEDIKRMISIEDVENRKKRQEIKENYKKIMRSNCEEHEKRKSHERMKKEEINCMDKLTLDSDIKKYLYQKKMNRISKIKLNEEGITNNLREKNLAKLYRIELDLKEAQRIENEIALINRKGEEKDLEIKAKQIELRDNVNQIVQKQLIDKKLKILNEKELNSKLEKDILRKLDERNELEREKSLKNKIKQLKYKQELEQQVLRKSKERHNEMSVLERALNKQLLEEIGNYNSPLHKLSPTK